MLNQIRVRQVDYTPLVVLGGLVWLIMFIRISPDEEQLAALLYFVLTVILAVLLYIKGIKRLDPDFSPSLFALAFVGKMIGCVGRYWMLVGLYSGVGDASGYHSQALYLVRYVNDFSTLFQFRYGSAGTTNLTLINTFIYSVLPPSIMGSYILFAGLAFTGSVLMYLAYRIIWPERDPQLYRFLIFFLPSILFWPSSLGKDAWIFFNSGLVAYGVARFLGRGQLNGLVISGAGIGLIYLIRPHIAAFFCTALLGTLLLSVLAKRNEYRKGSGSQRLFAIAIIVTLTWFVVESGLTSVGVAELSYDAIQEYYADIQTRNRSGSSYDPVSIFNPAQIGYGIITVLLRPFPWEATNAQSLVTAFEGILWLGLFLKNRQTALQRFTNVLSDPWLSFVFIYALIMVLALTSLVNFGLLARQRVMMIPFLIMLIV